MEYHALINGLQVTAHYSYRSINELFVPLLKMLSARQKSAGRRLLVMLAAPPAVGKSTLLSFLRELSLSTEGCTPVTAIGIDGFHKYQSYLLSHKLMRDGKVYSMVDVKGCPETFDLEKLSDAVASIAAGENCMWPVYDRLNHDPIENVTPVCEKIVILEGNYLLLDEPGWRDLHSMADYTIYIEANEQDLYARLLSRKIASGTPAEKAKAFVESSDMYNARRCLRNRIAADMTLKLSSDGEYHRV